MRIGLFIPCYIDAFFPEVGIATLELLKRFDHKVVYPRDQTCCGQPMANSGFNAECADTEALFVRNFSGFDYLVAPSGELRAPRARQLRRRRADGRGEAGSLPHLRAGRRTDVAEVFAKTISTDPGNSEVHYLAESEREAVLAAAATFQ